MRYLDLILTQRRSTLDNNMPYVDGTVTNYGSSKRDAVLGVSPSRLPSHSLNFLDSFARPSTTGVAHATTAKINILEIKYERDSAAPRAPSYTFEDSKFYSSAQQKAKKKNFCLYNYIYKLREMTNKLYNIIIHC